MYKEILNEHYYGDAVRVIFIVAGLVMIIIFPFFSNILKIPVVVPILAVLILAVLGGFLNPRQTWIIAVNTVVSILGCGIFQYYAANAYLTLSPTSDINVAFFWANQVLAILFFVAIYLSVKSFRGKLVSSPSAPG